MVTGGGPPRSGRFARRLPRVALPHVALPLVDQGVISAGAFLFNVLLARTVPLADYGRFAVVLGNLWLIQTICGSLVSYPASIRGASATEADRKRLILSALIAAVTLGLPLAALLAACVGAFVDGALVLPAFAALIAGQIQEATRRGLITGFRYGAAIPGDAVSYLGQAALLLVLARGGGMTLGTALWVMASTSLLSAAIQHRQIGLRGVRPLPLVALAADFWSLGRWTLASNILGIAKTLSLPWLLVFAFGLATAGAFQIAANLANIANPIIIGVCNIVPQVAARAFRSGHHASWRASWPSIAAGLLLIAGFVGLLLLAPDRILWLVYGNRTGADGLSGTIRILALGVLFHYAASACFAYLCGVEGGRHALVADVVSTLTMALAVLPLASLYGMAGAASAWTLSLLVRAAVLGAFTASCILGLDAGGAVGPAGSDGRRETAA